MSCETVSAICLSGAALGVCLLVALEIIAANADAAHRDDCRPTRWIVAQMWAAGILK